MAMRYGDTTKWDAGWYRWLKPKFKCAWDYMTDTCSGIGVLRFDLQELSSKVCDEITREEFEAVFAGRVIRISPEKVWLPGSFPFRNKKPIVNNKGIRTQMIQYIELCQKFEVPDEFKNVAQSYQQLINSRSECAPIRTGVGPVSESVDSKIGDSKIGDKKEESSVQKFENSFKFDYKSIFAEYPRHEKETLALDWMRQHLTTQDHYDDFKNCVLNYAKHCKRERTEHKFIQTFPRFVEKGSWRDWRHPNAGKPIVTVKHPPVFVPDPEPERTLSLSDLRELKRKAGYTNDKEPA